MYTGSQKDATVEEVELVLASISASPEPTELTRATPWSLDAHFKPRRTHHLALGIADNVASDCLPVTLHIECDGGLAQYDSAGRFADRAGCLGQLNDRYPFCTVIADQAGRRPRCSP